MSSAAATAHHSPSHSTSSSHHFQFLFIAEIIGTILPIVFVSRESAWIIVFSFWWHGWWKWRRSTAASALGILSKFITSVAGSFPFRRRTGGSSSSVNAEHFTLLLRIARIELIELIELIAGIVPSAIRSIACIAPSAASTKVRTTATASPWIPRIAAWVAWITRIIASAAIKGGAAVASGTCQITTTTVPATTGTTMMLCCMYSPSWFMVWCMMIP
mmetsp:Transcript_24332/g.52452  ORF Transcript_24332/g.52452 Transcript_24332/m.52452 type:complete len:217 (-) Transcript_24332:332-982(-)